MSAPTHAERVELNLLVIRERLRDRSHEIASSPDSRAYWTEWMHVKRLMSEIDLILWTERNVPRAENCLAECRTLVRL